MINIKIKKKYFRLINIILAASLIWSGLLTSHIIAETYAHIYPDYNKISIADILQKDNLDEQDYKELFYQTGLGKTAVDEIMESGDPVAELEQYQESFFAEIEYECSPNTIISNEEHVVDSDGNIISATSLAPLHNGYVLVTSCSHCYGWRNGHAAIVVDEQNDISLESVVLGTNSTFRNVTHWETFPSFIILKLKDASQQELDEIAKMASGNLIDVPYDLTVGIFKDKDQKAGQVTGTHCSHLVWQAFHYAGYDIDSDGGMIVTPSDIAHSDLFEVVQIYGMDPDEWWQ